MSKNHGRAALAEELVALDAGSELRLSHDDFNILFPPDIYGATLHNIGLPGHWCTDLAKEHSCIVRNQKEDNVIVFKKNQYETRSDSYVAAVAV